MRRAKVCACVCVCERGGGGWGDGGVMLNLYHMLYRCELHGVQGLQCFM